MLNLINPKLALALIRSEIETHVKHSVEKYQMIYLGKTNEIKFQVFAPESIDLPPEYNPESRSRVYDWQDSAAISNTLKPLLAEKLKPGDTLDVGVITWDKNNDLVNVQIGYTSQGEKLKLVDNI